ncbi:hypothetical protein A2U01_0079554, partial [Trifolium medium]|nr:hypothetical protein [Trifolium medium]
MQRKRPTERGSQDSVTERNEIEHSKTKSNRERRTERETQTSRVRDEQRVVVVAASPTSGGGGGRNILGIGKERLT